MGAQLKYGTEGATGGGFSHQPGSLQPYFEEPTAEPRWSWQRRSPKTWKDLNNWNSLWSWGCRMTGGGIMGVDGAPPIFNSLSYGDIFEPYSCDGPGAAQLRFFRGVCKDSVGTPVANAIVQAFRTSDDCYLGEVQANTDGTYTLGVNIAAGTACYLVAYKPGSPDTAGTTVNTLTPTNVDGS